MSLIDNFLIIWINQALFEWITYFYIVELRRATGLGRYPGNSIQYEILSKSTNTFR
jgi:hypothetical protein